MPRMPKDTTNLLKKTVKQTLVLILVIGLITSQTKKTNAQGIDITPPVTTYSQTPSSPDGDNNWYVSPVTIDITATDLESGIKEIWYRIDEGTWQTRTFTQTLNQVLNPSFEITDGTTTTGMESWEISNSNPNTVVTQDSATYAPNFSSNSAKITNPTQSTEWHGINNESEFVVTTPYKNMTASAWLKTSNLTQTAYFNIYFLSPDPANPGMYLATLGATSSTVTGTSDWTKVELNFMVNQADAEGVYIDIGFMGDGLTANETLWVDAVTVNNSTLPQTHQIVIADDSENHKVEFYSVDNADNIESYSCTSPIKNCVTFKLDQIPPGNWHDSGATRGFFGSAHDLWVYTYVRDEVAGLSVFSDKFMYKTELNPTFGRFSSILSCSGSWISDDWTLLLTPPFQNGIKETILMTPRTDFCNTEWQKCKTVRFYSKDMAGNEDTKDFCINGPWINFSGQGTIRSNSHIDMMTEAPDHNTDGLIEIANTTLDFFTSSNDWEVKGVGINEAKTYQDFWDEARQSKTTLSSMELPTSNGIYSYTGDFRINATSIPGSYGTEDFDTVIFVDGDLYIDQDVQLADSSTALFIVTGNVNISKLTNTIGGIAFFANGEVFTAYDGEDGDEIGTLYLSGLYHANKYTFQRTLQGTNNNKFPSEDVTYEPKYLVAMRDFFGSRTVSWDFE